MTAYVLLPTELFEGVGSKLASVVQYQVLWLPEIGYILLEALEDTVCVACGEWVELCVPTVVVYNGEYVPIIVLTCCHVCDVHSYSL